MIGPFMVLAEAKESYSVGKGKSCRRAGIGISMNSSTPRVRDAARSLIDSEAVRHRLRGHSPGCGIIAT